MVTVDQIRIEIRRVLGGSLSLDAFDEWISANSWNMHRDSDPNASSVLGKVELALAEYDGGFLTEAELSQEFRKLLELEFDSEPSFSTGSDSNAPTLSFQ